MARPASAVATLFGLGHVPWAPGTWGSAVGLAIAKLAQAWPAGARWLALAAVFGIAVAASTRAERELGTIDHSAIILDECWAMWFVTALVPSSLRAWPVTVAAFALFRAFDIVKPPPLKRLAQCPGGWGIVLDDLGAALYAAVLLHVWLAVWPNAR